MFVFALQFQQFLLETLPTNQIFNICVCIDNVVSVVSALRLQIFNMCVFFSMCSVQFKSGGIKEIRGGMFVFTLQFLQFLLETLKTIQIFDIRVRFHPVVSVVLSGRRYNFDMCVFFSVQCVVCVREKQRFLGVCSFSSCSFCSFYQETPLRIQIFNICIHFDPVVSVVFAWRL